MTLDELTAISPVDGRYRGKTADLANYFSEFALIRYRVRVEVEYFIALCELPLPQLAGIDTATKEQMRDIYRKFSETDAKRVKEIEQTTNHDVKAVEYFLKEKLSSLSTSLEFIHFGLTSQDINNTSVPLSVKEALEEVFYPQVDTPVSAVRKFDLMLIDSGFEWIRRTEKIPQIEKVFVHGFSGVRLDRFMVRKKVAQDRRRFGTVIVHELSQKQLSFKAGEPDRPKDIIEQNKNFVQKRVALKRFFGCFRFSPFRKD